MSEIKIVSAQITLKGQITDNKTLFIKVSHLKKGKLTLVWRPGKTFGPRKYEVTRKQSQD
jgi:hypothetical protein